MAINFPSSLDSLTNPTTSSPLNSPSHAGQHANANDAIEALEAKVGANSSAVTTSHDYKLSAVTGSNKAETQGNKRTSFQATPTDTAYPSEKLVKDSLDSKQDALVSGTNIKTVNSTSLLGSGNIEISGGSGAVDWIAKSANYTAENGDGILADTSGGAWTLTLPATPTAGDVVGINDTTGSFTTNNLTINRNGSKIMGLAENLVVDLNDSSFLLVYTGLTDGWKLDTFMPYGNQVPSRTATFILKDKDTSLAIGTAIGGDFRIPGNRAITITKVGAYTDTASATGSNKLTIDINEAGTSILSTKLTLDVGEKTSTTAATAAVISDGVIAADAILSFDIDQVNETTPDKGLKVWIEFTY